jgi:cyclophilin family peptidyl-prolyl cis-trans isomerase
VATERRPRVSTSSSDEMSSGRVVHVAASPSDRRAALRRRRRARLAGGGVLLAALLVGGALSVSSGGLPDAPPQPRPAAEPPAACGAEPPSPPQPRRYDSPEQMLERGVDYGAVIKTSCGNITIDLLEGKAPANVNSFVFLARRGFYDGLIWHRVEPGSLIQTGDPNGVPGDEPDGPGYSVPDEYPPRDNQYVYGVVAMSNTMPHTDSGGSQFFIIIHKPIEGRPKSAPAGLRAEYSIFGRASASSEETLDRIGGKKTPSRGTPAEAVRPIVPIYVDSIEITES